MKKIIFTLLFVLIALISNAQIYNTIEYYDKFDDCIKTEKVKTLINCNVIENNYRFSYNFIYGLIIYNYHKICQERKK